MQHEQAGNASRRKHDHAQKQNAKIKLPRRCNAGENALQERDDNGAYDWPEKLADAADEGHEQDNAGGMRTDGFGSHYLEVDGRQSTRYSGEETCQHQSIEAHQMGVIADELHALGVLANGICHASQRRAGDGKHGQHADERPRRNQVIHLILRTEVDAEPALAGDPIA